MRSDVGKRLLLEPGVVTRALQLLSLGLILLQCGGRASPAKPASLFQPRWHWQDEYGKDISFSRWRGAPVVVTVIYTSCKLRCPMTIVKLKKLDAAFTRKGQRAHFVLVTLDPSNDTPERLLDYKT